ncbi:MAG: hypothetical protein ACOC1U_03840 [Spirochaetota bacterium]
MIVGPASTPVHDEANRILYLTTPAGVQAPGLWCKLSRILRL